MKASMEEDKRKIVGEFEAKTKEEIDKLARERKRQQELLSEEMETLKKVQVSF